MNPVWKKNDKKAKWLIYSFSAIVFLLIATLDRFKLNIQVSFDVHIFSMFNAIVNTIVAVLLVAALFAAKNKQLVKHKNMMLAAMVLSVLFLVSYIAHHLLAGSTPYGGEGLVKYIYYFILITHIPLAGLVLPFILFSAYRGLIGEYEAHRKIAKRTWPFWFYVAITGPILYLMIKPYY